MCTYIHNLYTLYIILGHHKMITMAFPNFLSIIYPPLPLSFLLPSSVKSFYPEFFMSPFIALGSASPVSRVPSPTSPYLVLLYFPSFCGYSRLYTHI